MTGHDLWWDTWSADLSAYRPQPTVRTTGTYALTDTAGDGGGEITCPSCTYTAPPSDMDEFGLNYVCPNCGKVIPDE